MKLFKSKVTKEMRLARTRAGAGSGLRDLMNITKGNFYQTPTTDVLRDTTIDYQRARALYYNTDSTISNGAFFARPIIDGIADFIGIPTATVDDQNSDDLIYKWLNHRWDGKLWEIYRDALRDTKCWVRLRMPFPSPIIAQDEENDPILEVLDADAVTPYYDPVTKQLIRVEVALSVYVEYEPFDPAAVPAMGARAYGRVHDLIEIVTLDQYMYYDYTAGEFLEQYTVNNDWGFIPFVEVFNDFDTTLNGGSSELENVYPFLQAFHDLVVQTRTAHGYHADPKVKFRLNDVLTFLRNNFPESFDSEGQFNGKVTWKGRDVFFMESDEDAGFIEASLNTNESVELMNFVIDCICIAGGITESMLLRAKSAIVGETDELFRFKSKIARKRHNFAQYLQEIIKMALKISTGQVIAVPALTWQPLQTADLVAQGNAMNQYVTAAEVAQRAGVISKNTYRGTIRRFFPGMKDNQTEADLAQSDMQTEQQQQLDFQKKLQALNPPTPPAKTNGGGPNSATRSRVKLPLDVIPPQPGQ